jgi:hypothetical protein
MTIIGDQSDNNESNASEPLRLRITRLQRNLRHALLEFEIWMEIKAAYLKDEISGAGYFFTGISRALVISSVVEFETINERINVLLADVQTYQEQFQGDVNRTRLDKLALKLCLIAEQLNSLSKVRNRGIAHVDLERPFLEDLNKLFQKYPLKADDIERIFHCFYEVLDGCEAIVKLRIPEEQYTPPETYYVEQARLNVRLITRLLRENNADKAGPTTQQ